MKQQSVFVPVPVEENLPKKSGRYIFLDEINNYSTAVSWDGRNADIEWAKNNCTHYLKKKEDVFVLTKEELRDFAEQARRYTINNAQHVGSAVYVMGSTDDFFNDWLNTQKP